MMNEFLDSVGRDAELHGLADPGATQIVRRPCPSNLGNAPLPASNCADGDWPSMLNLESTHRHERRVFARRVGRKDGIICLPQRVDLGDLVNDLAHLSWQDG